MCAFVASRQTRYVLRLRSVSIMLVRVVRQLEAGLVAKQSLQVHYLRLLWKHWFVLIIIIYVSSFIYIWTYRHIRICWNIRCLKIRFFVYRIHRIHSSRRTVGIDEDSVLVEQHGAQFSRVFGALDQTDVGVTAVDLQSLSGELEVQHLVLDHLEFIELLLVLFFKQPFVIQRQFVIEHHSSHLLVLYLTTIFEKVTRFRNVHW